jgi:hypothetical protein
VRFDQQFDEPGTYAATVGNRTATVSVTADAADRVSPATDTGPAPSWPPYSWLVLGSGLLAAIAVAAVVVASVAHRRGERRA